MIKAFFGVVGCSNRPFFNDMGSADSSPTGPDSVEPEFALMESAPAPETVIAGRPYLYFGGTGYLGLASHSQVLEAGCESLRRYGVHSATSRSRVGTIPPVHEVETLAAQFFGVERAFYLASGYLVNHVLLCSLAPEMDALVVDRESHYSVLEAARLANCPVLMFDRHDCSTLEQRLGELRRVLVVADAVGPTRGDLAPVGAYLERLRGRERSVLLLDDAHGFGVLGERGRGLLEYLGLWRHVNGGEPWNGVELAVGGTLAKALGGFGGIIPGTGDFVEEAKQSSHCFDGASAPAAAVAGSSARALRLVMEQPQLRSRVRANSRYLRAGLRDLGFDVSEELTAHFGVSFGSAEEMKQLHEALLQRGIYLPFIGAYSGSPEGGLLRFAVFANHTLEHLDRLLDEIKRLL